MSFQNVTTVCASKTFGVIPTQDDHNTVIFTDAFMVHLIFESGAPYSEL